MAEYIEREILIKKLLELFDADFNINGDIMWSDHICTGEDVEDLIDFIKEEIPAAEVAEVVHGEWIYHPETFYTKSGFTCSVCKDPMWHSPDVKQAFKYCPHCGAKMDGGADNG
jgi:hypothetical protein